ncbi:MAG: type II secretion system F family protein [Hydrogenothermaceae bacterium]|nr:type II secretion system F family protein [Hydrogenothermaceae bacterium]
MAKFSYTARDIYGFVKRGDIEASSIEEAEELLTKEGFQDVKVSLKGVNLDIRKEKGRDISIFRGKVSERDLALFSRQMGAMLSAGISIATALEILSEQLPNQILKETLDKVRKDVVSGSSLAKSMSKFKNVFPEFMINLFAAAEESGKLDEILKRATLYYEKIAMIKGKIKSASWYPTAVIVIATLIVFGILTFIVPTFAEIYASMGGDLPFLTQILINISNTVKSNIFFIFGFLVVIFVGNSYFYKTPTGKEFYHKIFLKIPVLKNIFHKGALAKFARTLSTLINGGVPILRAIEISAKTVGNVHIEKSLEKAKAEVEKGKTLASSLDKKYFPLMFTAMVNVGENTGRLDEMLDTIANFYEDEVDREVDALISLLEPMLMVFIGGVVGFILIALYLPIFKIGELIK